MVNDVKNETLLKFVVSQHNQTSSNFTTRGNVYATPLLSYCIVKREDGGIKSVNEDRGFTQMNGDIIARIQNFESPWRSKLHFLNKGKSSASTQMGVQGSDERKEGHEIDIMIKEQVSSTPHTSIMVHNK